MADNQGDFVWYELMTSDADAAQAFYEPLLGWTFAGSGMSDMDYRLGSANGVEVVGLLELTQASHYGLMIVSGVFIIGRLLHALGLYMQPPTNGGPPWPRSVGVILSWLVILALVVWTLWMLVTGNL